MHIPRGVTAKTDRVRYAPGRGAPRKETPMPSVPQPLRTEQRPLDWFKLDERELARHDDPEKIRLLGQDMLANGQLQPVLAIEDGQMIAGHGRWLAAKAVVMKALEARLYPASLTVTQRKLITASDNIHHQDYTGYQKYRLCGDLLAENPTWR